MKITFKRNVDCDYYDRRLDETYPKYFSRWTEVQADGVENDGRLVHIATTDGNTIMSVPRNAVEITS